MEDGLLFYVYNSWRGALENKTRYRDDHKAVKFSPSFKEECIIRRGDRFWNFENCETDYYARLLNIGDYKPFAFLYKALQQRFVESYVEDLDREGYSPFDDGKSARSAICFKVDKAKLNGMVDFRVFMGDDGYVYIVVSCEVLVNRNWDNYEAMLSPASNFTFKVSKEMFFGDAEKLRIHCYRYVRDYPKDEFGNACSSNPFGERDRGTCVGEMFGSIAREIVFIRDGVQCALDRMPDTDFDCVQFVLTPPKDTPSKDRRLYECITEQNAKGTPMRTVLYLMCHEIYN